MVMDGNEFYEYLDKHTFELRTACIEHPLVEGICRGDLPVEKVWDFTEYNYYQVVETCDRILNRARNAPTQQIRNLFIEHCTEELGHPELALRCIAELGGDAPAVLSRPPTFELEGMTNWLWRLSQERPYIINAANSMFCLEGILEAHCIKMVEALPKHYGATAKAIQYWEVHIEADEKHTQNAKRLLSTYATTEAIQEECLRTAVRTCQYTKLAMDSYYHR